MQTQQVYSSEYNKLVQLYEIIQKTKAEAAVLTTTGPVHVGQPCPSRPIGIESSPETWLVGPKASSRPGGVRLNGGGDSSNSGVFGSPAWPGVELRPLRSDDNTAPVESLDSYSLGTHFPSAVPPLACSTPVVVHRPNVHEAPSSVCLSPLTGVTSGRGSNTSKSPWIYSGPLPLDLVALAPGGGNLDDLADSPNISSAALSYMLSADADAAVLSTRRASCPAGISSPPQSVSPRSSFDVTSPLSAPHPSRSPRESLTSILDISPSSSSAGITTPTSALSPTLLRSSSPPLPSRPDTKAAAFNKSTTAKLPITHHSLPDLPPSGLPQSSSLPRSRIPTICSLSTPHALPSSIRPFPASAPCSAASTDPSSPASSRSKSPTQAGQMTHPVSSASSTAKSSGLPKGPSSKISQPIGHARKNSLPGAPATSLSSTTRTATATHAKPPASGAKPAAAATNSKPSAAAVKPAWASQTQLGSPIKSAPQQLKLTSQSLVKSSSLQVRSSSSQVTKPASQQLKRMSSQHVAAAPPPAPKVSSSLSSSQTKIQKGLPSKRTTPSSTTAAVAVAAPTMTTASTTTVAPSIATAAPTMTTPPATTATPTPTEVAEPPPPTHSAPIPAAPASAPQPSPTIQQPPYILPTVITFGSEEIDEALRQASDFNLLADDLSTTFPDHRPPDLPAHMCSVDSLSCPIPLTGLDAASSSHAVDPLHADLHDDLSHDDMFNNDWAAESAAIARGILDGAISGAPSRRTSIAVGSEYDGAECGDVGYDGAGDRGDVGHDGAANCGDIGDDGAADGAAGCGDIGDDGAADHQDVCNGDGADHGAGCCDSAADHAPGPSKSTQDDPDFGENANASSDQDDHRDVGNEGSGINVGDGDDDTLGGLHAEMSHGDMESMMVQGAAIATSIQQEGLRSRSVSGVLSPSRGADGGRGWVDDVLNLLTVQPDGSLADLERECSDNGGLHIGDSRSGCGDGGLHGGGDEGFDGSGLRVDDTDADCAGRDVHGPCDADATVLSIAVPPMTPGGDSVLDANDDNGHGKAGDDTCTTHDAVQAAGVRVVTTDRMGAEGNAEGNDVVQAGVGSAPPGDDKHQVLPQPQLPHDVEDEANTPRIGNANELLHVGEWLGMSEGVYGDGGAGGDCGGDEEEGVLQAYQSMDDENGNLGLILDEFSNMHCPAAGDQLQGGDDDVASQHSFVSCKDDA